MAGLATTFGSGAMTNNIDDFANSKCVLAIGTNTTEAHPVLGMRVVDGNTGAATDFVLRFVEAWR